MTTRLTVPQLDANIVDVTITAWRKAVGVRVRAGEIVADITTDKAVFELESPADGTLLRILAPEKSVVPSAYILALLGEPGEDDPEADAANRACVEAYRAAGGGVRSAERGVRSAERGVRSAERGMRSAEGVAHGFPTPHSALRTPHSDDSALRTPHPAFRTRATPRARRLAQDLGIDLARVQSDTGAEVVDEAALQAWLKEKPHDS
jgi:pyruvate/2-oxoglutarate dehydrogenase complex dihydrolipoamide acyltransferase (E2) component